MRLNDMTMVLDHCTCKCAGRRMTLVIRKDHDWKMNLDPSNLKVMLPQTGE
jgi:hypothetical protein